MKQAEIRATREALGWTEHKLSVASGWPLSAIRDAEAGRPVDPAALQEIAWALGHPVEATKPIPRLAAPQGASWTITTSSLCGGLLHVPGTRGNV